MLPYDPFSQIDLMSTSAYAGLVDIISLVGRFVTAHLWFGLSFIQLLVIVYVAHFIIGICLGGIAPRVSYVKSDSYDRLSWVQYRVLPDDNHPVVVTTDWTHSLLKQ